MVKRLSAIAESAKNECGYERERGTRQDAVFGCISLTED